MPSWKSCRDHGCRWLAKQVLPIDERAEVERHLQLFDQTERALSEVEADIARYAMTDLVIRRLMTLTGVDMTVACGVAAAIGNIRRFTEPQKLVAYLGLNLSVRQSGEGPAYHGGSPSKGVANPGGCWLRQPGQQLAHQGH